MTKKYIKQAGTFGPLLQVTPCYAMTYGMYKLFGEFSFSKMYIFYIQGYGACYYSQEETKKVGDYYLEKVKKDQKFIGEEYRDWLSKVEELEKRGQKLEFKENDLLFKKFYDFYVELWARSIIVEIYDDDINKRIGKLAQEFNLNINEEEIIILTQPKYITIQLHFEHDLIQALKNNQNPEPIARKYYFLDVDYCTASPLNLQRRMEEIKNRGMEKEGERIESLFQKVQDDNQRKETLMRKKNFPQEFVRFLDFFSLLVEWRDVRKKMHQIGAYYIWNYIMNKVKVPEQLKPYILVQDYFEKKYLDQDYLEVLKKRCKNVLVTVDSRGKIVCLYDKTEIKNILSRLEEENKVVSDFRGNIANRGKIQGIVKVIKSARDFPKMQKGNILVAPMTRPEYLPVMKKAAAVITDEGGITCHAAIISRELNIPCIIGTKIATQVLKDGQLVEVDANHSRVKILRSQ